MKATAKQIERFVRDVLLAMDVNEKQCVSVVRNIVWHELDGRRNFGLQRLPIYVSRIEAGGINPHADPIVSSLSNTISSVDGDNGFGQFSGEIGIQAAIVQAKDSGVGVCTVKQSNFFGSGAYFINQACAEGMIAFAMSNSYPKVAAHGGVDPVLGTNPMAFGAPKANGDAFITDFATSALAGSTVRELEEQGGSIPSSVVAKRDDDGSLVLRSFGGAKGFSLSLMVEVLSGILAGAGVSHELNSMYKDVSKSGLNGHFFLALDIRKWGILEDFAERMQSLEKSMTMSGEARWPNALRREHRLQRLEEGVDITVQTAASLHSLADMLNIEALADEQ